MDFGLISTSSPITRVVNNMTVPLRNLPYFVYGTLRPGHGNYRAYLEGKTVGAAAKATLRGFQMYNLGGFPMAVHTGDEKDVIVGNLVQVRPKEVAEVSAALDRLEGYPSFYDKMVVTAYEELEASDSSTVSRMREVYVYVCPEENQGKYEKLYNKIPSGDWEKKDK